MAVARDTALPRMTAPITGPDGRGSVATIAPVYAAGAALDTVAAAPRGAARLRERRIRLRLPGQRGAGDAAGGHHRRGARTATPR